MSEALIASVCIASLSAIGALLFGKHGHVHGTHRFMVPIAMGVFLGIVFFELIPETLEAADQWYGSAAIVIGFLGFYLLSQLLHTYHHHNCDDSDEACGHRSTASLLLVGDAIHNIADGVIIVSAFAIDPAVGIATTIGIALHEIPQEIAEYGVFIRAGYTRTKALMYNLLSASTIIVGVVLGAAFLQFGDYIWVLTGLAAGNLLYIATSDMIPELKSEKHRSHFAQTFFSTLFGLVAITTLLLFTHSVFGDEEHLEETKMTTEVVSVY